MSNGENGYDKRLRNLEVAVAQHEERLAAQSALLSRIDENVEKVGEKQGEILEQNASTKTRVAVLIGAATLVLSIVAKVLTS